MNARIRATLSISLPDGSLYTTVSDILSIRVTDEFLDVAPSLDEQVVSIVESTAKSPVILNLVAKNGKKEDIAISYPISLDIYDDISGNQMATGVLISTSNYTIPADYTKKIGSYRFALHDSSGRYGETTLTVRSGPLAKIEFFPLSNAFVKGASSA